MTSKAVTDTRDDLQYSATASGFTTAVAELEEALTPPPAPVVEAQPEPKPKLGQHGNFRCPAPDINSG